MAHSYIPLAEGLWSQLDPESFGKISVDNMDVYLVSAGMRKDLLPSSVANVDEEGMIEKSSFFDYLNDLVHKFGVHEMELEAILSKGLQMDSIESEEQNL